MPLAALFSLQLGWAAEARSGQAGAGARGQRGTSWGQFNDPCSSRCRCSQGACSNCSVDHLVAIAIKMTEGSIFAGRHEF